MQSVPLTLTAFKSKGRNRTVTPTPVQDNCTIYIYIYIQYIKFFESQWTQFYIISSCSNFKKSWSCFPPLSKILDNGIEKQLKTNPNHFLKSANVLGATSATLDVADAACLLTSSKVSVCHWIFSSFRLAPAFPSCLLLLHQATYWKGTVGRARRRKTNRTEAEQVREKGKLIQKETWLIKMQYSLCWSHGPRKLRSQSKLWGWKQPGANETALLKKALNESHGALGTDIFLNIKHHVPPPPWKWACSLGKQLVQHPFLCSSAWHSWCRNPLLPGCPATISPSATASCLLP